MTDWASMVVAEWRKMDGSEKYLEIWIELVMDE